MFLQTKSLCIPWEKLKKGKKVASRWSSGEEGKKTGKGKGRKKLTRTAVLLPSYSKPEFLLFFRELCEPAQPLAMAKSLAISRDKEKTWDREFCFGVDALSVSLLVKISLLIMLMSTESDLKADTLGKSSCACFWRMLTSKGGWLLFSFPHRCQRVDEAEIRLVERGC